MTTSTRAASVMATPRGTQEAATKIENRAKHIVAHQPSPPIEGIFVWWSGIGQTLSRCHFFSSPTPNRAAGKGMMSSSWSAVRLPTGGHGGVPIHMRVSLTTNSIRPVARRERMSDGNEGGQGGEPGTDAAVDPDKPTRRPRTYMIMQWVGDKELLYRANVVDAAAGRKAIAEGKLEPTDGIYQVFCKSTGKLQLKPVTDTKLEETD